MTSFRFNCLKNKNTEAVLVLLPDTIVFNITAHFSFCFFVITLPMEEM